MDYSNIDIYKAFEVSKSLYSWFENFINNSIDFSKKISKIEFEKDKDIFTKYEEFKRKLGSKPNLDKNIFSALTPKMHHENVHSRIISFLINSDRTVMSTFLETLIIIIRIQS